MAQLGTMQGGRVEPGRALTSRFDLVERLRHGGLGVLYRATERASGQTLAVRQTDLPDAQVVLDAFGDLIALHERLADLSLVRMRSCGGADGCLWYAMDFVEAPSLHARVLDKGKPSLSEAVQIVIDAADTLAALHAANVIHQDLSTRNLFAAGGKILFAELGVAPVVARLVLERPGLITSPRLRASEQLVAPTPDRRTDLYALGVVLFFLLTGRRAINQGPHLLQLATDGRVPPPKLDQVPESLRPTLQRALAMRPDDRYATAQEFAAALRKVRT